MSPNAVRAQKEKKESQPCRRSPPSLALFECVRGTGRAKNACLPSVDRRKGNRRKRAGALWREPRGTRSGKKRVGVGIVLVAETEKDGGGTNPPKAEKSKGGKGRRKTPREPSVSVIDRISEGQSRFVPKEKEKIGKNIQRKIIPTSELVWGGM